MKLSVAAVLAAWTVTQVSAHMRMTNPPPLRSKDNPNNGGDIDFSETTPLDGSGSNYPCKGALSVLNDGDKGKSVADYTPGQKSSITIEGGAHHGGGSCQISLSYDQGKSFTTIQSYVGNCPLEGESSFDFTVPSDAPQGNALLAWTWYNKIGNREMYMNCASVTVGGPSAKMLKPRQSTAFSSRPPIFLANIGNGCKTEEGADLEFPDPGPDVVNNSDKTNSPVGTCAAAAAAAPPAAPADGAPADGAPAAPADGAPAAPADGAPAAPADGAPAAPTAAAPAASTTQQPATTASAAADATGSSELSVAPSPSLEIIPVEPTPAVVEGQNSNLPVSSPGGVFVTQVQPDGGAQPEPTTTGSGAAPAATEAAPAAEAPADDDSGVASPVPSAPTTAPAAPVDAAPASGGGSVAGAQSGPCSDEGVWNCIGSNQFQRCASGSWSPVMAMAEGTFCQPGISQTLFAKRRLRFMRW